MSASINDKLTAAENGGAPQPTTVSSARSIGGTTLSCVALTNWPTATAVYLITYKKKADGSIDRTTLCLWKGIVSGTTVGTLTLKGGTDAGNSVGDFVEMGDTSSWGQGIFDWGTTEHNVDGTHKDGIVTTAKIVDGAVDNTKVANGMVVQVASTNYSAVATGTTVMSRADTIPTSTQGTEFMTQTITPKSTTNILIIEANLELSSSAAGATDMIAALFQDNTSNAIAATYSTQAGTNFNQILRIRHKMNAGTTSATTFKVRAGDGSAGTTTFNGIASGRIFGGITVSNITVTEYKA